MKNLLILSGLLLALMLTGCAKRAPSYDYTAFKQSKPKSILVLPPENLSTDVNASHAVLSSATLPLAEAGYYVFPVAVVEETLKQNGLTNPHDIRAVDIAKLQQIFGADTALYIDVLDYGTKYIVINSETRVTANAKLIDLRNGKLLWSGKATASNNEDNSNNNVGIAGMLIQSAVKQIANTLMDKSYDIAATMNGRMLSGGSDPKTRASTGPFQRMIAGPVASAPILYGPRSPYYNQATR